MEVGNYVMLTFILLLIHDLRHDFNYKRWNKKIITFINNTEKLRVDLFKHQPLKGGVGEVLTQYPQEVFLKLPASYKDVEDGKIFNQNEAKGLKKNDSLVFICGHYKGIDQRVRDNLVTDEYSIGDYIITGGELSSLVIADSVIRLIPGVLNNIESAETDSFESNLLDCEYYTRPEVYRDLKVPDILLSGHHQKIKEWKLKLKKEKTKKNRPDLWLKYKNGKSNIIAEPLFYNIESNFLITKFISGDSFSKKLAFGLRSPFLYFYKKILEDDISRISEWLLDYERKFFSGNFLFS